MNIMTILCWHIGIGASASLETWMTRWRRDQCKHLSMRNYSVHGAVTSSSYVYMGIYQWGLPLEYMKSCMYVRKGCWMIRINLQLKLTTPPFS